ncbi:hypothetical protein DEU56DRAFT_740368, partial [Suillus clintonianus]|uniref:uncharacterized protein n=1 Tax=Suillus clintonianus TaxID=1904413 RepID=UPI001B863D17
PRYRHAAPSGPWPWMDFDAEVKPSTTVIDKTWRGYPQNLFGNWTPDQVGRSKMLEKCSVNKSSTVYWMDVRHDGSFATSDIGGQGSTTVVAAENEDEFWDILQGKRPDDIRVRSLFVDDLSSPVLRMLGTKYNIEPFFFTSSINWIPSRYQEAPGHKEGDHITITLPFVRTLRNLQDRSAAPSPTPSSQPENSPADARINTQAPVPMGDDGMLFIDLLAIHMVRGVKTSTIISYHPESTWCRTSAKRLHSLMKLVGESVYWQIICKKSKDPTPIQESKVLGKQIELTRDLHILQAHLLHYQSLLHNFEVSVTFIVKTSNPAMESDDFTDKEREDSQELMKKESENLLSEIDRLQKRCVMLSNRLQNVMKLAFATVNIEDSKHTRTLTEATVRDSAAMKQISYLTMVYLPASFLASVFGMNVAEFNYGLESLAHYVEATIGLTVLTIYVVITCQTQSTFHTAGAPFMQRAVWPALSVWKMTQTSKTLAGGRTEKTASDMNNSSLLMKFRRMEMTSDKVLTGSHNCYWMREVTRHSWHVPTLEMMSKVDPRDDKRHIEFGGMMVAHMVGEAPSQHALRLSACGACAPVISFHVLLSLFLLTDAPPRYRHAAPSGPWPWMDFDVEVKASTTAIDKTWRGYPQNLFGNWTPDQVKRSKMIEKCSVNKSSTVYWMDVRHDGSFATSDVGGKGSTTVVAAENEDEFWEILQGQRPDNIRVRSLFVDDLSSPVLRMLGTKYNIEPFFFTSSINWIPSRYQEAPGHKEGDHITITLPFVRTLRKDKSAAPSPTPPSQLENPPVDAPINTQAPFPMGDDSLFIDLLAIHMVRGVKTSTIISYHPDSTWCRTSAKRLHSLMKLVGESVYWQIIFKKSKDPTFVFLAILWYALYAWDESFELLYSHVSDLESKVLGKRIELTRDLHILQAHLLHYQSLLHNFEVSVSFIKNTSNPAMESDDFTDKEREDSQELMEKESENLLSEIDRLQKRCLMLSNRLKNVMDLAFATVNIDDSTQNRRMTEATVRDSAAMKQISYLTMVYLPASFLASVFGMNVAEFNGGLESLARYVEVTVGLTLLTIYVVVTLQTHSSFHNHNAPFMQRAVWPVLLCWKLMTSKPLDGGRTKKTTEKTAGDMV